MEVMKYRARDGMELTAYVTHPVGREKSHMPAIVLPHGGPELRDYYAYEPIVQFLASRGYRVVQPNFRGSAGYGKSFAQAGYKEWGKKMQDDIDDVAKMLIDKNLVYQDNLCIAGASYGGYAALMAAQRNNGLYQCAVSIAGVTDLLDFMEFVRREEGKDSKDYEYWLKSIGNPETEADRLVAMSPARNANQIEIPILLVHGEEDETVPAKQSVKIKKALEKFGKSVNYIELEGEGHSSWKLRNERMLLDELEVFFSKHLVGEYELYSR